MVEATHFVKTVRQDLSNSMGQAHNIDFQFVNNNWALNQAPQSYVYMYNVSEQTFKVSRPPLMRELTVPAKKQGEEYTLVTRLPQPLIIPKGNVDSNEIDILPTDARRFAMDICNPDNIGLDQDAAIDPRTITAEGNNIGAMGVFWSESFPPKAEEVSRAYKRMEATYKTALERARAVEISAPADISKFIGPLHHAAADHFGEEHTWHGKRLRTDFCPNCGGRIKVGAAYHTTEDGSPCILDWAKAVRSGFRSRAQAYDATGDAAFAPLAPPVAPTPAPVKPNNPTPKIAQE